MLYVKRVTRRPCRDFRPEARCVTMQYTRRQYYITSVVCALFYLLCKTRLILYSVTHSPQLSVGNSSNKAPPANIRSLIYP